MDTRAIPTTPKRSLPDACCMCNAVLFVLCHRAPLSSIIMPVFRRENLAEVANLDQYDEVDLSFLSLFCNLKPLKAQELEPLFEVLRTNKTVTRLNLSGISPLQTPLTPCGTGRGYGWVLPYSYPPLPLDGFVAHSQGFDATQMTGSTLFWGITSKAGNTMSALAHPLG